MKVSELIEILKKKNQNSDVYASPFFDEKYKIIDVGDGVESKGDTVEEYVTIGYDEPIRFPY